MPCLALIPHAWSHRVLLVHASGACGGLHASPLPSGSGGPVSLPRGPSAGPRYTHTRLPTKSGHFETLTQIFDFGRCCCCRPMAPRCTRERAGLSRSAHGCLRAARAGDGAVVAVVHCYHRCRCCPCTRVYTRCARCATPLPARREHTAHAHHRSKRRAWATSSRRCGREYE